MYKIKEHAVMVCGKILVAKRMGTAPMAEGSLQHLYQVRRHEPINGEMIYLEIVLILIRYLVWRYDSTDTIDRVRQ